MYILLVEYTNGGVLVELADAISTCFQALILIADGFLYQWRQTNPYESAAETTQQLYLCGIHGIISLIHSKNADFRNIQLNIAIHKIYLNIRCIS